eukprot:GHRR01016066.1.p1 GENE.GHRR01016066.1~~GHRR01016066.1.p1  ORF type:complete len:190 (+),score=61.71 GHRR01016066.1:669-1238(+)
MLNYAACCYRRGMASYCHCNCCWLGQNTLPACLAAVLLHWATVLVRLTHQCCLPDAGLQFEVARCRPQLTADFFKQLDTMVGQERFAAKPDQDRLAELETLRQYLEEGKEAVDKAVQANISAVDRMKKLLSAKDKKAMILEMAEANEIDVALMDLLQQNIDAARMAAQEEPAQFMEKVKQAAAKFLVTQ